MTDHKAELTHKVETLIKEKATTEQQMADCSSNIDELRKTINSQELSQEDVRRMEREKSRIEEQILKQNSLLERQVAALTEAHEKWLAMYTLLEGKVQEYNGRASQLELVPPSAKHAKGQKFEVVLNRARAMKGVVELMGGVDIHGGVQPHVNKLVKRYENEMTNEKKRLGDIKDRMEATMSSSEQIVEDIDVSVTLFEFVRFGPCILLWLTKASDHLIFVSNMFPHSSHISLFFQTIKDKITSCQDECETKREQLASDIKGKERQLDLLNTKISSLNDPKGVESTIEKYNAEYKQLQMEEQRQGREIMAMKKSVNDEIRKALVLAREFQVEREKKLSDMNEYIGKRKEEGAKLKLLDS